MPRIFLPFLGYSPHPGAVMAASSPRTYTHLQFNAMSPLGRSEAQKTKWKESRKEKSIFHPLLLLFCKCNSRFAHPNFCQAHDRTYPQVHVNFCPFIWPSWLMHTKSNRRRYFYPAPRDSLASISSLHSGILEWNTWLKPRAPPLLHNSTNFTIITLSPLEIPYSSISKTSFLWPEKIYERR